MKNNLINATLIALILGCILLSIMGLSRSKKELDVMYSKLNEINAELSRLEPKEIMLPTPTPETVYTEIPVVETVEVVKYPAITAHHYEDPNHVLMIDIDSDKFFVYQYEEKMMMLDNISRYVYFEIVSMEDLAEYKQDEGYTLICNTEESFNKAYLLSSDMALVIYVPKDDTWFLSDLNEVADRFHDAMLISLG